MLQVQTGGWGPTNALQDPPQDSPCHQGRQKETPQEAERPRCPRRRICPNRSEQPSGPVRFQRNTGGQSIRTPHGSSFLLSSSSCFSFGLMTPLYNSPITSITPFPNRPLSNRAITPHAVLCHRTSWCTCLYCLIALCSIASLATTSSFPSTLIQHYRPPLHSPSFPTLNPQGNTLSYSAEAVSDLFVIYWASIPPPRSHLVLIIPFPLSLSHVYTLFLLYCPE